MHFLQSRRKTRFGEVLNPARGRTTDCALPTNYNHSNEITVDGGRGASDKLFQARPTTQLRFAVPAHIAHPHGVPPWHSGEEGVAGAIDRHFANRKLTDLPQLFKQILRKISCIQCCADQSPPSLFMTARSGYSRNLLTVSTQPASVKISSLTSAGYPPNLRQCGNRPSDSPSQAANPANARSQMHPRYFSAPHVLHLAFRTELPER